VFPETGNQGFLPAKHLPGKSSSSVRGQVSGFQFRIVAPGSGLQKPKAADLAPFLIGSVGEIFSSPS